jgi:hypothetical protein
LEHIQIRKIALYVQNFQDGVAFRAVQPIFLKLMNSQFPELFDVTTLLQEESLSTSLVATQPLIGERNKNQVELKDPIVFMEPHFQAIRQQLTNPDAAVKGMSV